MAQEHDETKAATCDGWLLFRVVRYPHVARPDASATTIDVGRARAADLECRIRAWDDGQRRALLPFF
jgi:hypothetical protein